MRRFVFFMVALLAIASVVACGDHADQEHASETDCGSATPAPRYVYGPAVSFGSDLLQVEIADDSNERRIGLMNRTCLGDDWGMIFVYPNDVENTFWMKDTLVPLSIAWIRSDGTILEIEDMQPQTEDLHSAPGAYRYAIEANQGWFAQHGIATGGMATLPPNLSAS